VRTPRWQRIGVSLPSILRTPRPHALPHFAHPLRDALFEGGVWQWDELGGRRLLQKGVE